MFDVGPPGHATNNIIPIAIVGDTCRVVAKTKPMKGKSRIWQNKPMNMAFGNMKTLLKSFIVNDKPIPNIIIMSEIAKMIPAVVSIAYIVDILTNKPNSGIYCQYYFIRYTLNIDYFSSCNSTGLKSIKL